MNLRQPCQVRFHAVASREAGTVPDCPEQALRWGGTRPSGSTHTPQAGWRTRQIENRGHAELVRSWSEPRGALVTT